VTAFSALLVDSEGKAPLPSLGPYLGDEPIALVQSLQLLDQVSDIIVRKSTPSATRKSHRSLASPTHILTAVKK
jgi:hypothetical protein